MERLQNQIQTSIFTILGLLITLGTLYAVVYLNKAIAKVKAQALTVEDDRQRKILTDTIDRVHKLLVTNIVAVEQTTKKALIESSADGKISKEDLQNLAVEVKNNVINQLGEGSIEILSQTYGDINGYITAELEKQIADLKGQVMLPKGSELEEAQKMIEEAKKELNK